MDSNSTMNFHRAYSTRVEATTTVAIFTATSKFECAERWRFRSINYACAELSRIIRHFNTDCANNGFGTRVNDTPHLNLKNTQKLFWLFIVKSVKILLANFD